MVLELNRRRSPWGNARTIIGERRVALGPQASDQWVNAPEHLAMVLSRYRAASTLIGNAQEVLEVGCGEGIGASILAKGRRYYCGIDTDAEALEVARALHASDTDPLEQRVEFLSEDILTFPGLVGADAAVSLDVIEHIPSSDEGEFMRQIVRSLTDHGVCAIGTPNATAHYLASPQSKAGHINNYSHGRLKALMAEHFFVVQMFGMQDVALHFGHGEMAHYLIAVGIAPR